MLATLIQQPFDRAGWLFEIKWDGYRAIAQIENGEVLLYSRKQIRLNPKYPEIVEALGHLHEEVVVLDGEIVVVDDHGKPEFALLQNYPRHKQGHLVYYVFDLLYADGRDWMISPLHARKERLGSLLPESPHLKLSDHIEKQGIELFDAVRAQGLEGIIAKDGK